VLLVLVRHGIAEDRDAFAKTGDSDDQRPLTKQGRWKMEKTARGLRHVEPSLAVIATSPLVRAAQTAAIVAAEYRGVDVTTVRALAPDAPVDAFLNWLRRQRSAAAVAAVGHEPHLSTLATWLCTAVDCSAVEMKKGGACAVQFESTPAAGHGRLLWALSPALLRRLADT
jgi:phosphohistidine phosphatase